jgi:hypothetical protein
MNMCPICLFVNGTDASACTRCGKFHFPQATVVIVDSDLTSGSDSTTRTRAEGSPSALTKPSGTVSVLQATRAAAAEDSTGQIGFNSPLKSAPRDPSGSASGSTSRLVVRPRLEVVRGEKLAVAFPVLEGRNIVGRMVNAPVDIDLTGQEPAERVWTSRQHACLIFDGKMVVLEDMNSLNGTFVNRQRVFPGQQRVLNPNDVIQVGTVQLRLLISADRIEVEA